jgi:membrane fusion protein, copper/silver efflux system
MSADAAPAQAGLAVSESASAISAPATRWQKLRLIIKVMELRLRFVSLMAITALVFAYADTLWNRYEKWMRPVSERQLAVAGVEFYCPMHPHVIQAEPGQCAICGMPLAKRLKREDRPLPAGVTSRVELAPSRVAQAGIKNVEVGYATLARTVETVGYVAFDERLVANIVSKVPGKSRVEKLYVNVTGQTVVAGQPLAELYSPELSQAIEELLIVTRRTEAVGTPEISGGRLQSDDWRRMLRASSEKLKRWGITGTQIEQIVKNGGTGFKIPILSPISGHVFKKNVVEGQEVPEGFPMFELVDLDAIWVQAQVYEHQLGLIHEGQPVVATVDAFPGESFPGRLEFMQPHLDPATRTVEVRYSVNNPGHRLRPGMFATVRLEALVAGTPGPVARAAASESSAVGVSILQASLTAAEQKHCPVTTAKLGSMGEPVPVEVEGRNVWTCCAACPPKLKAQPARYLVRLEPAPAGQVLSVPESAVIDTGTRKLVYVESEPGIYEGREVMLGPRAGDRFPVLEGLAVGEKVAAAGAFLIDAESRLNPVVGGSTKSSDSVSKSHKHH